LSKLRDFFPQENSAVEPSECRSIVLALQQLPREAIFSLPGKRVSLSPPVIMFLGDDSDESSSSAQTPSEKDPGPVSVTRGVGWRQGGDGDECEGSDEDTETDRDSDRNTLQWT
jgi:hypothetical protein